MPRRSSRKAAASSQRAASTAPRWPDWAQEPGGGSCGDRLGDAAGDQLAEHGVQPAGGLVAQTGQVAVALGRYLQHRRVIIGPDLPDAGRPQRGDRHRPGIVGIVFVNVTGRQQPHPGGQVGRHIQHPLTSGQQLLGHQMADALGALDCPGPLRPGRDPRLPVLVRAHPDPGHVGRRPG